MIDKEWAPFITHYLRVNKWKVLQVEVHPLYVGETSTYGHDIGCVKTSNGSDWFADRHLQEILQLLKETIYTRVSLTPKETVNFRPDVITGPSLRLGYAFKKRAHHQFYLTLHNTRQFEEEDKNDIFTGHYIPYQIHREKMIVHAMPVGGSVKTGMSKLLNTLNCGQSTSVDISSYFVKSPRKSQGEITLANPGSKDFYCSLPLPQQPTSSKAVPTEPVKTGVSDSRNCENIPCILIDDTCQNTDSHVSNTINTADKKTLPEQDIKQTLKKFTSKLSKQYKRKMKATRVKMAGGEKRQKVMEPLADESLPDLTQVWNEGLEQQITRPDKEKRVQHYIEEDYINNSECMAGTDEADLFVDSDLDNQKSNTDVFENGMLNPTSLIEQTNLNNGVKRRKPSRIQKGKSFKNSKRLERSLDITVSPVKDCSVHLEQLSEAELLARTSPRKTTPKMSPSLAFLRGPVASSSGIRVSRRISEIYSQCDEISEVIDVESEEGQLDVILNNHTSPMEVKDEEVQVMWTSIRSAQEVSDLSEEQLVFLIHQNKLYLKSIFQGKSYCGRHQDYKAGGKSRNDLIYQLHFGAFSDEQSDLVMDTLMSIFCRNHKKYLDYLMKVLLPEMFVKIYMDVFQINYLQAVNRIQDYIRSLEMTVD